MEWNDILKEASHIKEQIERSYKCINIGRPIKQETLKQHFKTLIENLESIRVILNVNYYRLTAVRQRAADTFNIDIRNRILRLADKKAITIELPDSLHENLPYSLNIPQTSDTMGQTIIEFLNTASKLITDFDGSSENLRSFIDSLKLVDSIKDTNESTAISLIKTKLKGHARNLIENETTIEEIINTLNKTVKGESVEVLTGKIMNTKQTNKTANIYCNEIEKLTKSLEDAYISDGLKCELATKYSTQVAVKALTKNCNLDKVKLIM